MLGLTGPTGAGKSTVSGFFAESGFAVINADELAHEALLPGCSCLKSLCGAFGDDILNADGTVNRQCLAARAFSSKENTQLLNDITHPWIFLKTLKLCREYIDSGKNKIIFDAPVLFESNSDIMCDAVVCVAAPKELRMERLERRDGLTREQLEKRMSAQPDNEFYMSKSDYVIDGSQPLENIRRNVCDIARVFL